MTPSCELDHLVVVAPSLARGVEFVAHALGVEPGPGGAHPRMGTHNRLLRLGASAFLEVIAPDPTAPRPARPRWFGLDELDPAAAPRLAGWVARTHGLRERAAASAEVFGDVETMTRGSREWLITIRPDGRLPQGGALPSLIEWLVPARSAAFDLPDRGCSLARFTIEHPQAAALQRHSLAPLGLAGAVDLLAGERVVLAATIDTPHGLRTLG